MEELSHEFLALLVKEGYLKEMPLHDRADASSWSVYHGTREGNGVACRVHGVLSGEGFARETASAAGPSPVEAFARERAAETSPFPPMDRIALGGPISAAALGLDASLGEVTLAQLVELARSSSPRTRAVVALALRRMRHKDGVPVLKGLLTDPDEYVRKQAAWALGNIGTPADADALARLLADPAERVRDFAAFALARLGDDRGVGAAIGSLKDPARNPIRRGEAAIALADGPVNLYAAAWEHHDARWKDAKVPKERPVELAARVREAVGAVLATAPPADLAGRCTEALERLEKVASH